MGFAFLGISVTSFGASQALICEADPPGTCPESLDVLIAGLGVGLMILGFALALYRRGPLPPLVIRLPKP